jgi:hypothetical protein
LDRVHVGIRENHTGKKVLDFCRDLVHFGPNLLAIKMAPIFVILVANMSFLPTSHTSQAQLRSPHFRQMPPKETTKTKNWGQAEKDLLAELIQAGLVEIKDLSLKNIEAVWQEHFRHRSVKNFRRSVKDFSAAFDLKAEYSGARLNNGGKGKLRHMMLITIRARVL